MALPVVFLNYLQTTCSRITFSVIVRCAQRACVCDSLCVTGASVRRSPLVHQSSSSSSSLSLSISYSVSRYISSPLSPFLYLSLDRVPLFLKFLISCISLRRSSSPYRSDILPRRVSASLSVERGLFPRSNLIKMHKQEKTFWVRIWQKCSNKIRYGASIRFCFVILY